MTESTEKTKGNKKPTSHREVILEPKDLTPAYSVTSLTEETVSNETPILKVFKIHDKATIPTKASDKASCFDVYVGFEARYNYEHLGEDSLKIVSYTKDKSLIVYPKSRALIPTGIRLDIPEGYEVFLYSRSGLSFVDGLILTNSVGIIDEDYRGELFISVTNTSSRRVVINNGTRIAQLQLRKRQDFIVEEVKEYDVNKTKRATGGFGSTGEN